MFCVTSSNSCTPLGGVDIGVSESVALLSYDPTLSPLLRGVDVALCSLMSIAVLENGVAMCVRFAGYRVVRVARGAIWYAVVSMLRHVVRRWRASRAVRRASCMTVSRVCSRAPERYGML